MNTITLDDDTRRFIGDNLLGIGGYTMPVSGLSEVTGISRPTLKKWIDDDRKLHELTRHISDDELMEVITSPYYPRVYSAFCRHAKEYCHRVLDYRRRTLPPAR